MSRSEPTMNYYERERIILQHIRDNPHLHHNGLLKIIVPEYMAKTTFEKTRNSLVEKEIIFVEKKRNMKFYVLTPNYRKKSQQRLEQNTNKTYHDLKLKIKRYYSLSINSLIPGGSGANPFLFLISATAGANIDFGTSVHSLNDVFHVARPAV